jgi:hypothetical protein
MSKCYLIASDLQTTQNAESSSNIPATIVRAIIRREHIDGAIYALDICPRPVVPPAGLFTGRAPAHDEFSGN